MDGNRFDDMSRLVATGISRRKAVAVIAAGLAGALGVRVSADAQNQVPCGNEFCAHDPGVCNPGCVCCLYYNPIIKRVVNSRCRPPGSCSPADVRCPSGQVYDPARGCVTPQATTTTTTSTTTTAAPPCGNACSGETPYCVDGACAECRTSDDCFDGVACTDDVCNQLTGRCEHLPIPDLCAPTEACTFGVCDPPNGDPVSGCVFAPIVCPDDGFTCTRNFCDPVRSQCVTIPDSSLCVSEDACFSPICVPGADGSDPTTGCLLQPISCDDNVSCTVDTCLEGTCSHTKDDSLCPRPFPLALEYCLTPLCDPEHDENSETGCRFVDTCNVNGVLDPGCGDCQQCSCQAILGSSGLLEGRCVPSCPV